MKKVLLMLVACAAMTACQQKGKTAEAMDNVDSTETMDSLRFQKRKTRHRLCRIVSYVR